MSNILPEIDVQKSIIRQSSVKASLEYFQIKGIDFTLDEVIDVASEISWYCAYGKKINKNNKLLK